MLSYDKSKIKAFFFDIDGTLMCAFHPKKKLSQNLKETLESIKKKGYKIFLATGRPYAFIMDELRCIDFDGMILSDGAYIIHNHKNIYQQFMDEDEVNTLVHFLKINHINYALHGLYKTYLSSHSPVEDYIRAAMIHEDALTYDENEIKLSEITKIHIYYDSLKTYHSCIKELSHFIFYNDKTYKMFEIRGQNMSKQKGLEILVEELAFHKDNLCFFGDGINDIEIMDYVGYAYAMDNASDEVKRHAREICDNVYDEGVIKALQEYLM